MVTPPSPTTTSLPSSVVQQVRLLEPRPFRPFKTSEEYLYAMKEDLAEWLHSLYQVDINVDNFLEELETGVLLCQHANKVRKMAEDEGQGHLVSQVVYRTVVVAGSFPARDNVSNFISWCRGLGIYDCLLFETEDLVMRKNEKSFILCLLEVARRGARWGMPAPLLVQMEQEIDRDIAEDLRAKGGNRQMVDMATDAMQLDGHLAVADRPQIIRNDLKSLDEMVRDLVNRCTCPEQFLMLREAEGKYRIGETKMLIYVRILRSHVMVRVGGGWDTLEHFLDKHDPCRCRQGHRPTTSSKLTIKHGQNGVAQTHMQVTYERSPVSLQQQQQQQQQQRQQSLSPMNGSPPRMRKASSSSNSSNQPSSSGSQTSLNAEKVSCEDRITGPHTPEEDHRATSSRTARGTTTDNSLLEVPNGHKPSRGAKPAGSPRLESGRRVDRSPRRCKVACLDNSSCQCPNQQLHQAKRSAVLTPGRSPSVDNLCRQATQNPSSAGSVSRRSRRLSHDHSYNCPSPNCVVSPPSPTRPRVPSFNRSMSTENATEASPLSREAVGRFSARERRMVPNSSSSSSSTASGRRTWTPTGTATRSRPSLGPDTFRPPQVTSRSYNSSPTKSYRNDAQMVAQLFHQHKVPLNEEYLKQFIVNLKEKLETEGTGGSGGGGGKVAAAPSTGSSPVKGSKSSVVVAASGESPDADGQCYTKQWVVSSNGSNGNGHHQRKRRSSLASPSSPDSGSDLGCELQQGTSVGDQVEVDGSNVSSGSSTSLVVRVSPRKDLQQTAAASKIPMPVFH